MIRATPVQSAKSDLKTGDPAGTAHTVASPPNASGGRLSFDAAHAAAQYPARGTE